MTERLKQARKGQTGLISEDRQDLTILIPINPQYPLLGGTDNPFQGRISHERSIVPEMNVKPVGFSTNLQRFLSVEYNVDFLVLGGIITDRNNKKWKLGPVDPLERFGGIYGYQAPLEDANG